ncbi:hypothetical protein FQR65_LT20418 [Abscondita terminalis]|nr:hypothetical protein FQR65_LT20418 [Abscondita terminalis]
MPSDVPAQSPCAGLNSRTSRSQPAHLGDFGRGTRNCRRWPAGPTNSFGAAPGRLPDLAFVGQQLVPHGFKSRVEPLLVFWAKANVGSQGEQNGACTPARPCAPPSPGDVFLCLKQYNRRLFTPVYERRLLPSCPNLPAYNRTLYEGSGWACFRFADHGRCGPGKAEREQKQRTTLAKEVIGYPRRGDAENGRPGKTAQNASKKK